MIYHHTQSRSLPHPHDTYIRSCTVNRTRLVSGPYPIRIRSGPGPYTVIRVRVRGVLLGHHTGLSSTILRPSCQFTTRYFFDTFTVSITNRLYRNDNYDYFAHAHLVLHVFACVFISLAKY